MNQTTYHEEKITRRPRAAHACELCRAKKNKCDELYPCTYCKVRGVECVYRNADKSRRTPYSQEYVRQLEKQVKDLTESIQQSYRATVPQTVETETDFNQQGSSQLLWSPQSNYEVSNNERPYTSVKDAPKEVTGVNRHTKNVEFYGSSSSMAFLSRIQQKDNNLSPPKVTEEESEVANSLISALHNPVFSPPTVNDRSISNEDIPQSFKFYSLHARQFLAGFFDTLYYIHPILDQSEFLSRCEDLWNGNFKKQSKSFIALYYSLLSLGALIRVWEEDTVEGMNRFQWSRMLFEQARLLLSQLSMTTDLDMVHCFFFMTKICQNELNPHMSYMYLGMAVRTALAMGINREPLLESEKENPALSRAKSRTWWGLYSLETELSFALGRPDTLGAEIYHNRSFPQIAREFSNPNSNPEMDENQECAMIEIAVHLSRITKDVAIGVYLSTSSAQEKIVRANQIEQDLDRWLESLPTQLTISKSSIISKSLKAIRSPKYAKIQKLVLGIRYHNVRMILFASFLIIQTGKDRQQLLGLPQVIGKCVSSAKETIEVMHETYRHHDFFRTWWYNTTYTLFAVSIVLVYIVQEASEADKVSLFEHVEMGIEVLEAMDECCVAKRASDIIRRALSSLRENLQISDSSASANQDPSTDLSNADISRALNSFLLPLQMPESYIDPSFSFEWGNLDQGAFGFSGNLNMWMSPHT